MAEQDEEAQERLVVLSTSQLQDVAALTTEGNLTVEIQSVNLAADWVSKLQQNYSTDAAVGKLRALSRLMQRDAEKFFNWTSELMRQSFPGPNLQFGGSTVRTVAEFPTYRRFCGSQKPEQM